MIITYDIDLERTYRPKAELPPNPERMAVVFADGRPVALLGHIGPMLDIALQEFPEALVRYAAPDGANGLLIWEGHVAWAAPYGWAEDGDYVPTGKWRAPTAEEVEYIADDCWPWDSEQWLEPDQPKNECPRCALSTVAGHRCAFVTGTFDSDNWNCGTMNALRAAATGMQSSGDEHSVLFDIEAFDADVPNAIFLVLQWYKRRGRTTSAVLLGEHGHEPLTLEAAETIIEACKRRGLLDAKAATAIDLSGIDLTGVEAVDGLIDEVKAGLRSEPRPDADTSHGFTTIRRTATGETFAVPAPPPYMADTMRPDVSLPGEPPEVSMARRDWMAAQHGAAYNGWRPEHPAPVEALRAWLDAGEPLTYPDACALLDEVVYLRGAGGPPASQPEPPPQPRGGEVTPSLVAWLEAAGHTASARLVRARDAYGRAKYGQGLHFDDGRDGVEDLRQELGDALQYAWKVSQGGMTYVQADEARTHLDALDHVLSIAAEHAVDGHCPGCGELASVGCWCKEGE